MHAPMNSVLCLVLALPLDKQALSLWFFFMIMPMQAGIHVMSTATNSRIISYGDISYTGYAS